MSEEIEVSNLVTKLSIDDSGVEKSMAALSRQMKVVQSEFQAANARLGEHASSQEELKTKADGLTKQLDIQRQRVIKLKEQHEEAAKAKGKDAKETQDLEIKLNKAVAQYNKMHHELQSTTEELNKQTDEVNKHATAWQKASSTLDAAAKKMDEMGRSMSQAGQSLSFMVTAPIVGAGVAAGKASIDFESAFAGVRKTVDATEEEFKRFEHEIREMSKQLPATATEIAGVAEAAGQLGIDNDAIMGFTRTMTDLGVATNMSSEQAATALARLANITQMPQSEFDRLGATIVDLGNNLASTESEIVEMGLRLAGAGKQIGLTEAEILAFAGSLSSVGIEAEAGGSAFSRVMIEMSQAVMTGSKNLDTFAGVAGMTTGQFKSSFEKDAAGALASFIEGLGKMSAAGKNTFAVLDDLKLSEIRVRDALLRASNAGDLFRNSLELGTRAWEENTALTEEAEQRYETTASKLKMLGNRIVDSAITLGDTLVPVLMSALDALEPLINSVEQGAEWFANLDASSQKFIITLIAMVAAAGPLLILSGKLVTSISALIPVVKGLGVALNFLATNPIALVTAGIALAVGAFFSIKNSMEEAKRASEELAQAQADLQEVQQRGIDRSEVEAAEEKIEKLNELIDTYQKLIDKAAESNAAQNGNNALALDVAIKELGVDMKKTEAVAAEFGVTLKYVDDTGKLSAESMNELTNALQIYTKAVSDAKRETASEINEKAKTIAGRKQEVASIQELVKTYNTAKKGSDEWKNAQNELARQFPHLVTATGLNIEAINSLINAKEEEIATEWVSIQTKATEALQEKNTAIAKQEAAIKIAESISKITGSSGLAESAVRRMNDELERLRGEAAALQAIANMKPEDIPVITVKPYAGSGGTGKGGKKGKGGSSGNKAYENKALDEAYRQLEHKKRMDQLTLESELKTLEQIKKNHIKTAQERMGIEERIYDVKKAIGDRTLDAALKAFDREKELGKLSEKGEIERLRNIRKLYADSAEERERIDDMIFDASQRKIEAEKRARTDYFQHTSQQLKATFEDRVVREKLSDEEIFKLKDKLLNEQIYLNKSYLEKVLEDDRYTASEKRQIEREITEAIRLQTNERLQLQLDYNEEVRKAQIESVNELSKSLQDALKAKYQAEKEAAENSIRAERDANEAWKSSQLEAIKQVYDARTKAAQAAADSEIERINRIYNARIEAIQKELDALDQAEKEKSRAELDAEDQKKIDRLSGLIDYEHDEFNKVQLQKELNKILSDQEKRHQKEQLEDKKEALKDEQQELKDKQREELDAVKRQLDQKKEQLKLEYEAQQTHINTIYAAQKASLDQQLKDTQEHYNKLLLAKSIQAEAEKMIIHNQQDEIIKLLEGFGDSYKLTGQTLGEKMYEGFKDKVTQIQTLIDNINRQIDAARNAAISAMATATTQQANKSVGSSGTTNNKNVTVNNTFNTPVTSPSDVSRATQKTAQQLALG